MVKFSDLEKGNLDQTKSTDKAEGGWNRPSSLSFRDLEKETQRIAPIPPPPAEPLNEAAEEERKALYDSAAEYLTSALDAAKRRQRFALEPGEEIIGRMMQYPSADDPLLMRAVHQDTPREFLVNHCVNVTVFALKMAAALGLSRTEQQQIGLAALLHEIGMGLLPDKLKYKGSSLDEGELAAFKKRPEFSYTILKGFGDAYAFLAETALQVHEYMDGSGYPRGLKGNEIHLYAQIIGLADFYEALIHPRPQRDKFLHFDALKQVIKTGKRRYPRKMIKALLNIFSIFPVLSLVKLNSHAIGRVIQTCPEQPMRPKIEVLFDSQGRRVLARHVIDLSENSILFIVESVSQKDIPGFAEGKAARQFSKDPASIRSDRDPVIFQGGADADLVEITEEDFLPQPSAADRVSAESGPERFTTNGKEAFIGENFSHYPEPEKERWISRPNRIRRYKWVLILIGAVILVGIVIGLLGRMDREAENRHQTGMTTKPSEKKVSTVPQQKPKNQSTVLTDPKKEVRQTAGSLPLKTEKPVPETDGKKFPAEPAQFSPDLLKNQAPPAKQVSSPLPPPAAAGPPADSIRTSPPRQQPIADKARTEAAAVLPPAGDAAAAVKVRTGLYPFSIKVDAFRTPQAAQAAQAALPAYRAEGLNTYWVKVDLGKWGVWYRLFVGTYSTRAQAEAAARYFGLIKAAVKETKYAASIGMFPSQHLLDQKIKLLSDKGYCPYVIRAGGQAPLLLVGAFYTRRGAEEQVADLFSKGIRSEIIER